MIKFYLYAKDPYEAKYQLLANSNPLKICKTKIGYQKNFPYRNMYPLFQLFAWFRVWFVLGDMNLTLILLPPPRNYVN